MFITVRFGNNQEEIFNPNCQVVHLIDAIKRKCVVNLDQWIDITDESGLLTNISSQRDDKIALDILPVKQTYILVEKRVAMTEGLTLSGTELLKDLRENHRSNSNPRRKKGTAKGTVKPLAKFHYFPLLRDIYSLYPDYCIYRTAEEKKSAPKNRNRENKASSFAYDQRSDASSSSQRKSVGSPTRALRELVVLLMESFSYKDQCPDLVLGHSGIANLVASFRIMCYGCHSQIVTEMSLETAQLHSKNLFFCFKCRPSTGAEVLSDRYCKVLVFTSLPTSRSEFAAKKGRLHNKPVRLTSSGDEDIAVTNKPIPNQQPANSNELMYRSFTNLYLLPTSTRLTVRPANHSRLYESTTQEGDKKLSSLANSWELNETIDKLKSIPVDPSYKLKSDYRCLYCDKTFVYKAYWKHHEEKFMCRKANTCKICGKIYAHRSSLSRHRLVHTVDATNK